MNKQTGRDPTSHKKVAKDIIMYPEKWKSSIIIRGRKLCAWESWRKYQHGKYNMVSSVWSSATHNIKPTNSRAVCLLWTPSYSVKLGEKTDERFRCLRETSRLVVWGHSSVVEHLQRMHRPGSLRANPTQKVASSWYYVIHLGKAHGFSCVI